MALVDLDRELYNRTVKELKEELEGGSHQLLLEWILREHKIEADALRAEVARLKEKTEAQATGTVIMGRMLSSAIGDPLPPETPDDLPDFLRKTQQPPEEPTPLDEAEAMRRVNEMLAEIGEKPLDDEEANDLDKIEDELAVRPEAFREGDDRPKNWMQKNPIGPLQPAPIVTVEPEPYKPEGPVSDAETARIRKLIGDQRCERLSGEQYALVVQLRMRKQTVSQIADAVGLQPASCGAYLRSTDRHVTNLMAHPREEWREEYLRQLALACQRRNA